VKEQYIGIWISLNMNDHHDLSIDLGESPQTILLRMGSMHLSKEQLMIRDFDDGDLHF
jgi:predicted nuclease of predicted toxin-antitoxin system